MTMTCVLHLLLYGVVAIGPGGDFRFQPGPAEADVPAAFRLTAATFHYDLELLRTTPSLRVSAVRFPSPVDSPDPENNIVHAELFEPTNPPPQGGAGVVVLHILGADFALSRYLAARMADRGITALFVKLPYYGERRPARLGDGKKFLSADIERSTLAMRQGICDVRRAAAWLAKRPGVDPDRLGIAGISLGGIVGSVAAAVDPSLNHAALLLAGGDLARILWEMPESEAARARQSWIDSGRTLADLEKLCRPYDPLTHAARLQGKKVLMFAGRADEVVPPACSKALWEKAGRPEIEWLDCGHYSAAGLLLPAFRRTVDFFAD